MVPTPHGREMIGGGTAGDQVGGLKYTYADLRT